MRLGTSLTSVIVAHEARAVTRTEVKPGGEVLQGQDPESREDLMVTVDGVDYPVLVLGVDDPEDEDVEYWIL